MSKRKVGVLYNQTPYMKNNTEQLVFMLVKKLKERGFDAEAISIPFHLDWNENDYKQMILWRLVDLSESNGEKIDLIISTQFPNCIIEHSNKVCWFLDSFQEIYDEADITGKEAEMLEYVHRLNRISCNALNRVYAVSDSLSKTLKKFEGIDAKTLHCPPFLRINYVCQEYGDYLLATEDSENGNRIDLLLYAIKKSEDPLNVIIITEGQNDDKLVELIEELGIEDQVKLTHKVDEEYSVNLYANTYAVYYAPEKRKDDFVVLETFLSHKPVITIDDMKCQLEFVKEDVNSVASSPDPEELAKCINSLYKDKKKCKTLGNAGYQMVKDISWNAVIDVLTESIKE